MTTYDPGSRLDDASSRRLGTFSYLPALSREQIEAQVGYMISRDWTCAVEHVEPARAGHTYWYMWGLPMFGVRDPGEVLAKVDACRDAHPGDLVRLIGYDRRRQTQGLAIVVHRG